MWSSGPISQGQFSGKAWREHVMTRQPAAEKRFTVACPMPRLAPVKSSVRRGWLECDVGIVNSHRCRVGKGARYEVRSAWAKSCARRAHVERSAHTILPTLRIEPRSWRVSAHG